MKKKMAVLSNLLVIIGGIFIISGMIINFTLPRKMNNPRPKDIHILDPFTVANGVIEGKQQSHTNTFTIEPNLPNGGYKSDSGKWSGSITNK